MSDRFEEMAREWLRSNVSVGLSIPASTPLAALLRRVAEEAQGGECVHYGQAKHWMELHRQAESDLAASREEVRRLRGALKEIARQQFDPDDEGDCHAVATCAVECARAALAETGQEEGK